MKSIPNSRSRAATAALLLAFVLTFVAACGGAEQGSSSDDGSQSEGSQSNSQEQTTTASDDSGDEKVQGVTPDEILSDKERTGFDESEGWESESGAEVEQISSDTSAGAIPAVQPFNFGRDPGGPEDKTLSLDVPEIGLEDVEIYDSTTEEDLKRSAIHVPSTGFPWQKGANTYIAGHRIGYPGTGSDEIFYDLDKLEKGDEITVTDADGAEYRYEIFKNEVVGPENVEVMNAPDDGSIVTLQTCTLPDYLDRIVVQGELVEGETTET